ncbi:MAG: efflux RND transporter periplasmic adaptor subunit [Thermodesulfovibrionales bacterium]|nr:efflux RND transporter periplasmic adaptor subunit [Thermodesulfovibrionales bacterium]
MIKKCTQLLYFLFFITFFITFITACSSKEKKAIEEKIINVKAQSAEKRIVQPYIETTGSLIPYEEVIVSAEIDGIIKEIKVEEGSPVSKGTLIATINETDYDLDVKRNEAVLRQAQATLENVKLEFQRKSALYKEQLITQQQFDDVTTRLALAEAELERAKSTLFLSKQKLIKTKIYSPIDGFIKEKKVSAGNYARNGSNLFVIIKNNPIKLTFTVSEKDIGKLKKGQEITFRVDAYRDKDFKGKVNIIYPNLDEKTRSLQVEALSPNLDGLLKPGLFAKITLFTDEPKEAILIPAISLLYEAENIRAFIIEGDVAKRRNLKIGQKYKFSQKTDDKESRTIEYVEVIEGIKEAEIVVTAGQQNLSENTKVKIVDSRQ